MKEEKNTCKFLKKEELTKMIYQEMLKYKNIDSPHLESNYFDMRQNPTKTK